MDFLCVHCDEPFSADEARPRCPKCMRATGVRPVQAAAPPARGRWRRPLAAVTLAAVLGAGGYLWWTSAGDQGPSRAERRALADKLDELGVEPAGLDELLSADDRVRDFARRAAGEQGDRAGKAEAVVAALRKRAQAGAFVSWTRSGPLPRSPYNAAQVAAKLAEDDARMRLYPLEVAALAVAALRALDAPAQLAEVHAFEGASSPADPSGRLGYFALAVPGQGPEQEPLLFDPYGGRTAAPAAYQVLEDGQAIGLALGLRGAAVLANARTLADALDDTEAAVALAPRSPTARGMRAAVLLTSGGAEEGERELRAAAELRSDAPRTHNLAVLHLATGDTERASRYVARALEQAPEFAPAYVTLANVHMGRREPDLARQALEQAQRIEPELPRLSMAWAHYHLSQGDPQRALEHAERAVRRQSPQPEPHVIAAQVYRALDRFEEMRRHAQKALELTPASQRQQMRPLLLRMLGPTALDAADDAGVAAAPADLDPLGDTGDGPSLLDDDLSAGGDSLRLGGEEPKLRLRPPGGKLKLDLGNDQ